MFRSRELRITFFKASRIPFILQINKNKGEPLTSTDKAEIYILKMKCYKENLLERTTTS